MQTFYHGTSKLFPKFDPDHALEGDGKIKHGAGFYLTNSYKRAAHYSCKRPGSTEFYVYTVEIPDLTPDNYIEFRKPVNPTIIKRVEEKLGEPIPEKETTDGKLFRKYIAMKLAGKKETKKLPQKMRWLQPNSWSVLVLYTIRCLSSGIRIRLNPLSITMSLS